MKFSLQIFPQFVKEQRFETKEIGFCFFKTRMHMYLTRFNKTRGSLNPLRDPFRDPFWNKTKTRLFWNKTKSISGNGFGVLLLLWTTLLLWLLWLIFRLAIVSSIHEYEYTSTVITLVLQRGSVRVCTEYIDEFFPYRIRCWFNAIKP